ncbi:MAG: hypothetical protein AAF965_01495 [Pseudomonadota bacterium]
MQLTQMPKFVLFTVVAAATGLPAVARDPTEQERAAITEEVRAFGEALVAGDAASMVR